jgi:hypothetical protein
VKLVLHFLERWNLFAFFEEASAPSLRLDLVSFQCCEWFIIEIACISQIYLGQMRHVGRLRSLYTKAKTNNVQWRLA